MADLRADLFRSMQFLPLRFYDKRKVGSLISRMNNDSDQVEGYLIFDAPFVLSNATMIVGILALLFYMNWQLTLYVLLPVLAHSHRLCSLIWNRLQGYWRRWSARWARLSTHLNESIGGIRVVKAFAQETREGERFDRRNHALRDVSVSAERSWLVFFMVTNFFMSFGAFFVWVLWRRANTRWTAEARRTHGFYLLPMDALPTAKVVWRLLQLYGACLCWSRTHF